MEPEVLLDTPAFVAMAKPPGMETISQDGGAELTALARRLLGDPGLVAVHRLDRDTSGVQVLARTPEAERELTRLFRQRRVHKTYLAVCLGVPRNRSGTVNRNLSEWGGGRRPVRVVKGGGLAASTGYEVLRGSAPLEGGTRLSLVRFEPHQGRTHQIRVHAASLGFPILGDDQYGDRHANAWAKSAYGLRRQALHAWMLDFPWTDEEVHLTCPPPQDMAALVDAVFGAGNGLSTP